MSSVGGKPSSGSTTEWPQQASLPGGEFLDPFMPGFHLIPPGRGEHGGPQLGADRRQPGLFEFRKLASGSLGRLGQGGKTVRAEAFQGETILDHAFGCGKAVPYVAQLSSDRGQFRWLGELLSGGQEQASLGAVGGVEHPGQPVELRGLGPGQRAGNGRFDLIRDVSQVGGVRGEPLAEGRRVWVMVPMA